MAILPTRVDLGTVLPNGQRPIAVADASGIGRGIAQLGQGAQQLGFDLDRVAKQQEHQNNLVEGSTADTNVDKGLIDLKHKYANDGDYATQGQRYSAEANKLIADNASLITNSRARALWAQDAQRRALSTGSAVTSLADAGIQQGKIVQLDGNLDTYRNIVADPKSTEEQRAEARKKVGDTIDAGVSTGVYTPAQGQLRREQYLQGSHVTLGQNLNGAPETNPVRNMPAVQVSGVPTGTDVTKLPAGMQNNNPGNLKYANTDRYDGVVGPSKNLDQGSPQIVFSSAEAGMKAMGNLLLRKFGEGKTTPDQLIAGENGWTPGNHQAAANVAKTMGIAPDAAVNLRDPKQLRSFMGALIQQEHGDAGKLYPDALVAKGADLALHGGAPAAPVSMEHPPTGPSGPVADYATIANMGNPKDPGWEKANLVTIQAGNGQSWQVNKQAAAAFQGLLRDLEAEGYSPQSSGGYNYRTIRGSGKLSQHAFGAAIDIGAVNNPMQPGSGPLKTDLPANISELARKNGLIWGGDWKHRADPMHFQWAGPGGIGGQQPAAQPDKFTYAYEFYHQKFPDLSPDKLNALADNAVAQANAFNVQDKQQAAEQELVRKQQVDQYQYGARNGQIGLNDIENAWNAGQFKNYEEYSSVRSAYNEWIKERDEGAGAVGQIFGKDSTTQFNPFDEKSRKIADNAYQEIVRAAPDRAIDAIDAIHQRTGIVPKAAANGMRAAIYGADQQAGSQALQIASNLMTRNPNAFAGVEGGTEIAKSAAAYQHFIGLGMSSEDAARRVQQMNDPAYRAKITVKDDDMKAFLDGITANTIAGSFDNSTFGWRFNPRVGTNPQQQAAIVSDYKEAAQQAYLETGDPNIAKAVATAQLAKVYGVSSAFGTSTVTKYPPEKTYPPVKELVGNGDPYAYVYRQASEAVKQATGKDVMPTDIALLPVENGATAQAYGAGKPVPYRLAYVDRSSGQPEMQIIWGDNGKKVFFADPQEAEQAVKDGRAAEWQSRIQSTQDFYRQSQQQGLQPSIIDPNAQPDPNAPPASPSPDAGKPMGQWMHDQAVEGQQKLKENVRKMMVNPPPEGATAISGSDGVDASGPGPMSDRGMFTQPYKRYDLEGSADQNKIKGGEGSDTLLSTKDQALTLLEDDQFNVWARNRLLNGKGDIYDIEEKIRNTPDKELNSLLQDYRDWQQQPEKQLGSTKGLDQMSARMAVIKDLSNQWITNLDGSVEVRFGPGQLEKLVKRISPAERRPGR